MGRCWLLLGLSLAGCGTPRTLPTPPVPKIAPVSRQPVTVTKPPWSNIVVGAQFPAGADFPGATPSVAFFQISTDLQTWREVGAVPYVNQGGWLYYTNARTEQMFFRAGYR